jgi:hypothetical protein
MAGMHQLQSTEFQAWRAKVAELGEQRCKQRLKRRVAELEAKVKELDSQLQEQHQESRKMRKAISRVFRNCEAERRGRALCRKNDCEGCALAEGIARRCLSPSGPSSTDQQLYHEVHAIHVGDDGVRFCRKCRGVKSQSSDLPCPRYDTRGHAPSWSGVLELLNCTVLGAQPRVEELFPTHNVFLPIPSAASAFKAISSARAP